MARTINLDLSDETNDYRNQFKYVSMRKILLQMNDNKTSEALLWKKDARRYLKNFPLQFDSRKTISWDIDDEVFDSLQRRAQTILIKEEYAKGKSNSIQKKKTE